jgi:predicted DNA-binding antitoxin AbrB/MazE fold protein
MATVIKAVYKDGVLKPLEPLGLPEDQVVELQIQVKGGQPRKVAKLKGAWADYLVGGPLSDGEGNSGN